MPISPILRGQATYPFVRLNQAAAARRAEGLEVIDFGMGDPREPTDPRIIEALRDGVRERMGYPAAVGLPELREAVAGWVGRRFGVTLDPDRHVIPTLGSKEAIFSFAQVVLDLAGGRDTVVVTEPGYPVGVRGAQFAGARVVELPLLEENGFLPDLDAVPAETWQRTALVWVNYPNNPTGATAPLAFYERLAALAREHDFVLASDEAYTELWFDEPPVSALQLADWTNLAVFNTLSKRSSMTGYRSGFVAGDPELDRGAEAVPPERRHGTAGVRPARLGRRLGRRGARRAGARVVRAASGSCSSTSSRASGLRDAGGPATMYLWVATPDGETSEGFATRLLEHGVLVAPGSFLGASGEGYVRFALVPTEEECARAVEILERAL